MLADILIHDFCVHEIAAPDGIRTRKPAVRTQPWPLALVKLILNALLNRCTQRRIVIRFVSTVSLVRLPKANTAIAICWLYRVSKLLQALIFSMILARLTFRRRAHAQQLLLDGARRLLVGSGSSPANPRCR